jgi:hypothetical protein
LPAVWVGEKVVACGVEAAGSEIRPYLGEPSRLHPVHLGTLRACRFPVRATDLQWMISHTHFQTSRTGRAREKLRDFLRFSVTLCNNG